MREKMTPLVDEIAQDRLGGIFGIRHTQSEEAPRVMIAAHMDEVGFMVTQITDRGLFKVSPLGGWNPLCRFCTTFCLKNSKRQLSMYFFLYSTTFITWQGRSSKCASDGYLI